MMQIPVSEQAHIKCVIVGDGAVGKTCLLVAHAGSQLPDSYIPTIFDNFSVKVHIGQQMYIFDLIDTAGQEIYENLRKGSYVSAHVFLLCFSISLRSSFENVVLKWLPDIKKHVPFVPVLLVGCQSDLRFNDDGKLNTAGGRMVTYREGTDMAKRIGAVAYMECSAKTGDGVDRIFTKAFRIGAGLDRKSSHSCSIS